MAFKRRRGTVIVDTPEGILMVSHDNRKFYLPGGGAEKGETRKEAAIRELREETNLQTINCLFLFEYEGFANRHKVFLINSIGTAKPSNEIKYIDYFRGSNLRVSDVTWEIIELYRKLKKPKGA